jgi:peroxiredoxin
MRIYLLLLTLGFVSVAAVAQKDYPYVDDVGFIVKTGQQAPDFKIEYANGDPSVKLSDLRGNVVLLQFTASWCGVCREEMPHLEKRIWQRFKDKHFYLIGIDRKEPLKKVKTFSEIMKISYPLAMDIDEQIYTLYAHPKSGVTRNVLIDKSGKIVFLTRLFKEDEFNILIKKTEEELGKQ